MTTTIAVPEDLRDHAADLGRTHPVGWGWLSSRCWACSPGDGHFCTLDEEHDGMHECGGCSAAWTDDWLEVPT